MPPGVYQRPPLPPRFWAKVDTTAGMFACWIWTSTVSGNGYGQFWVGDRYRPAHQVAWELTNGSPFPAGLQARHSCDTPLCVNPTHVTPGTAAENCDDKVSRGRQHRPIGDLHPMAKLTAEDVAAIRSMAAARQPQRAIASTFGITESNVSKIVRHVTWAA